MKKLILLISIIILLLFCSPLLAWESNSHYPTGSTQEDHVFYESGYWYVFYSHNQKINCITSIDGEKFTKHYIVDTPDIASVIFDVKIVNEKLYIAWDDTNQINVYITTGLVKNGNISNFNTSRILKGDKSFRYSEPSIAFDKDGEIWIAIRYWDFLDAKSNQRYRMFLWNGNIKNIKDITVDVYNTDYKSSAVVFSMPEGMGAIYGDQDYLYFAEEKNGWIVKSFTDYKGVHDFCVVKGKDGYPKVLYLDDQLRLSFIEMNKDGWGDKEIVNDFVRIHSLSLSRKGEEYYAFYVDDNSGLKVKRRISGKWSKAVLVEPRLPESKRCWWTSSNRVTDDKIGVVWCETDLVPVSSSCYGMQKLRFRTVE